MKHAIQGVSVGLILVLSACTNDDNPNNVIVNNDNDQDNATVFEIDVPAAQVDGTFSLNGGAFPVSQYQHGLISFADTDNNQTLLSETYNGGYDVFVVKDEYSTLYSLVQGAGTLPSNKSETVSSNHTINVDQMLDIDVISVSVRFQFTLDGVPFPATEYDDAVFYLQSQGGGERIVLGNSHGPIDPALLMPGTYDVIYELETGGSQVPVNQNAIVATEVIDNTTPGVTVDVKTIDFRFSATLDGGAFPVSQYEHGRFMLINSAGDVAELGKSYELPFTVKVIEGNYDIVYSYVDGTDVPVNMEAVVASNIDINTANPAQSLDILTALITPQYSLDGGAFPVSEYQDAQILLRGFTDNDIMVLGNTHDANPVAVKVVRGDYDVIYSHETGDQVPLNSNFVAQTDKALNADQDLAIDISSVNITGTFTLNGGDFPASAYEEAEFYLSGADPDDVILLGFSFEGSGTVQIISGTYDVIYKHVDGSAIPQNSENTIMAGVLLNTSQNIGINVDSTSIKPVFTLNGGPFPESGYENADLYLHGTTAADRVFLGRSYLDNEALKVINGTYGVFYEYEQGSSIPVNSRALVDNIDIL